MEEQELLDCLSEDVSLGIELAIRQYGKAVKTICQSILSGYSGEDIEEAISDTFVGLWRSREKIKLTDGQGLREYLYGIARRTALNKQRTLAKEHSTQNIDTAEELVSGENVEEQIVSRSEYEILYQLVNSMKSPDREIFIYRYFYQHSIKEIADKLALKAKTVENKLSRGKHRLRQQLLQCGVEVA